MRAAGLAVAAVLLVACGGPGGTMSPVPPPSTWSEDLVRDRRDRDAEFASDPDSPIPKASRASFRGLDYFPADASWRYAGWVERYAKPTALALITTNGEKRPCERWGRVTFLREGRVVTLQVYRLLDLPRRAGGDGLFLPFKDRTTGTETYSAGRYVELTGPEDGPFVLDFNRAHNPSCAYGEPERFQCPVTPAENTLALAVTAGERGPKHAAKGAR